MREQGAQADDPHAPGSGALGQRLEAFVSGAAYGVLAVLGFVLGLIGSFLFSGTIGSVPVAAIVLVLLNFACFRLAAWAMCSPLGALAPAVPWLVVVVLMSARRPEGDLVITGTTPGYLFMVGGMIAGLVAVVAAFSRSAGSWLLRGVDVDSRAR
ncbi:hypothetical protein GCM10009780_10200 [Actinomadura alba]